MNDQEFRTVADHALNDLHRRLSTASDRHAFEADFNSGALTIEFEDPPAKFVVSPNSPVRQIWVSAHSKSFKLDWEEARAAFVLASTKQTLVEMIGAAIGQQLGETVTL
jgi:CyaY protein